MAIPMSDVKPPRQAAAPRTFAEAAQESLGALNPGDFASEPINILIVDDEPKNLTVLRSILDRPDYRLVCAESAEQALLGLLSEQYALLILDVRMPEMTGLELAQIIKERKKTARVPIIFLTAYYSEDQHILEGYGAGAVDYLHKPVNASILRSKVAVFAELYRKNREALQIGQALLREIGERRRTDEKLRDLNETLEQRVTTRTAELLESRARLRHAADLARLTYFDLDHASGRIECADNFASIMGFELSSAESENAIADGKVRLQQHVSPGDRARVAGELDGLEGGAVRRVEYRVVGEDGRERWIESEWHHEVDANHEPRRTFVANLDITERKQAEEQKRLLMAEINHRSKNLLSVVQALVSQSARRADPALFATTLSDRLQGLSASQDLLIKCDWRGIEMSELVLAQLGHFKDLIGTRISFRGPLARLTPAGAQAMGMALHELGTNAAKYGSLSNSQGIVHISWQISSDADPIFCVRWNEEGGPPVAIPTRKGFGHLVIGAITEAAFAGTVELDFSKTGLLWSLRARVRDALEIS
jgi:two-component sensor histidine kinase/DNA-binding response OmpR family regulator